MVRLSLIVVLWATVSFNRAAAIEDIATSSYNVAPLTSGDIANWNSGWTQPATQPTGYTITTGWNYVGKIGGASGTYLGNGWVITAAHVQAGDFTLNNVLYPLVPNSAVTISKGTVDLVLFRVFPAPALPPLPLRTVDPIADGSQAALVGYGGTGAETWGYDTVNYINYSITPSGSSWVSNDFLTVDGTTNRTIVNNYQVVSGDSGGGDFIYNSTSNRWELAGINEVMGTVEGTGQGFSGFVQIDTYAAEIEQDITPPTDTPTLPEWALAALGVALVLVAAPRLAPKQ